MSMLQQALLSPAERDVPLPKSGCFDFTSSLQFDSIPHTRQMDFFAMASLRAGPVDDDARSSRAPLDVVAVLDRSGSMAPNLGLVRDTVAFMALQLKPQDRLGVVCFDSTVDEVAPLTVMDDAGRKRVRQRVAGVRARGSTNLSGGILKGLSLLKDRTDSENRIASVMVFTDGFANEGIKSAPVLAKAVEGALNEIPSLVTVYAFGFGAQHDPAVMRALSDAGNGMFYYVEKGDDIPAAFADCLGGLLTVAAQNIDLTAEAGEDVTLLEVLCEYTQTWLNPGKKMKISLGDIYGEESRDILFRVRVHGVVTPTPVQHVVSFSASMFSIGACRTLNLTSEACMARPNSLAPIAVDDGAEQSAASGSPAAAPSPDTSSACQEGHEAAIVAEQHAAQHRCSSASSSSTESDAKNDEDRKDSHRNSNKEGSNDSNPIGSNEGKSGDDHTHSATGTSDSARAVASVDAVESPSPAAPHSPPPSEPRSGATSAASTQVGGEEAGKQAEGQSGSQAPGQADEGANAAMPVPSRHLASIDRQYCRYVTASALAAAAHMSSKNDFDGAQKRIQEAITAIRENLVKGDFMDALLEELRASLQCCTQQIFQTGGRAKLLSASMSHYKQRATTTTLGQTSSTMYMTSRKSTMRLHSGNWMAKMSSASTAHPPTDALLSPVAPAHDTASLAATTDGSSRTLQRSSTHAQVRPLHKSMRSKFPSMRGHATLLSTTATTATSTAAPVSECSQTESSPGPRPTKISLSASLPDISSYEEYKSRRKVKEKGDAHAVGGGTNHVGAGGEEEGEGHQGSTLSTGTGREQMSAKANGSMPDVEQGAADKSEATSKRASVEGPQVDSTIQNNVDRPCLMGTENTNTEATSQASTGVGGAVDASGQQPCAGAGGAEESKQTNIESADSVGEESRQG